MRFEKSTTWLPEHTVWRVMGDSSLPWGPFCYSKRDAAWQWFKQVWMILLVRWLLRIALIIVVVLVILYLDRRVAWSR